MRLLRSMFPSHVFALSGIDPRTSVQDLSRSTHASRVTVRRRLARWREEGFWKSVVAFPNPNAFGTNFQMQSFVLERGQERTRLESALNEVFQPVFLFQTEDVYNPVVLAESVEESARRQRVFRDTGSGVANCPPLEVPFPSSGMRLTPRDWQIIAALRRASGTDWATVAKDVGVTVRGLERRVARLMAEHALFFFPELDFRRSPGSVAWVGALFARSADARRLESDLARRYPDLLPVEPIFPFEVLLPPAVRPAFGGSFAFLLSVPSASTGDQLRRDIGAIPGVVHVLVGFPTQNLHFPQAFDGRIELARAGRGPPDGVSRRAKAAQGTLE